jgi:hypothetical protein
MYRQLVEIYAIASTQQAGCARWRRSDPTSIPIQARANRQGPIVEPSAAMMAPPQPTDFSPQASS